MFLCFFCRFDLGLPDKIFSRLDLDSHKIAQVFFFYVCAYFLVNLFAFVGNF